MADLTSSNNPLTANGTFTVKIQPGQEYAFGAAGTWGGGSLAINWKTDAGNSVAFDDSPLTADGGFVFVSPAQTLSLVLSGATSPSIEINISKLD